MVEFIAGPIEPGECPEAGNLAQITAIALANRVPLAVHNGDDFEEIVGMVLVDPSGNG